MIIWMAREELGNDFDGRITLEVKGGLYVPFITIEGFGEGTVFKRGKPRDITWTGGRGDNVLKFELYKGDNCTSSNKTELFQSKNKRVLVLI